MPRVLGYYRAGGNVQIWTSEDDTCYCRVTYITYSNSDPATADMVFIGYLGEFVSSE